MTPNNPEPQTPGELPAADQQERVAEGLRAEEGGHLLLHGRVKRLSPGAALPSLSRAALQSG